MYYFVYQIIIKFLLLFYNICTSIIHIIHDRMHIIVIFFLKKIPDVGLNFRLFKFLRITLL